MAENLDIMIAFVVIIIGLSMTLQLVMDFAKSMLGIRWSVYRGFLTDLYVEHFGKTAGGVGPKESSPIQSVSDRLRSYATKLGSLLESAREVRAKLVETHRELESCSDAKTLEGVRDLLGQRSRELRGWAERIRALHPDHLLSIYNSLRDSGRKSAVATVGGTITGTNPLEKTDEHLDAIDEVVFRLAEIERGRDSSCVASLASCLGGILPWVHSFEARIESVHARLEVNFDDALSRLQDSYAKRLKNSCFWAAVSMCFILNADAVLIFTSLRQNSDLTQSVIQQQEAIMQEVRVSDWAGRVNALSTTSEELRKQLEEANDPPGMADFIQKFNTLSDDIANEAKALGNQPGVAKAPVIDPTATKKPISDIAQLPPDAKGSVKATLVESGMGRLVSDYAVIQSFKVKHRVDTQIASGIPLGWSRARFAELGSGLGVWLLKFGGIFLMAFLISFGAPVWNDVLKALLGLKGFLRGKGSEAAAKQAASPTPSTPTRSADAARSTETLEQLSDSLAEATTKAERLGLMRARWAIEGSIRE